jgi:hypothetical protein
MIKKLFLIYCTKMVLRKLILVYFSLHFFNPTTDPYIELSPSQGSKILPDVWRGASWTTRSLGSIHKPCDTFLAIFDPPPLLTPCWPLDPDPPPPCWRVIVSACRFHTPILRWFVLSPRPSSADHRCLRFFLTSEGGRLELHAAYSN